MASSIKTGKRGLPKHLRKKTKENPRSRARVRGVSMLYSSDRIIYPFSITSLSRLALPRGDVAHALFSVWPCEMCLLAAG